MAVRKVSKNAEVEVQVEDIVGDIAVGDEVTTATQEENTVPEVDISLEEEEKKTSSVEIDTKAVAEKKVIPTNVRVKMKTDHKCYIGGELYDLKEGVCYNVPKFVKSTLNKAGVLIPL